MIDAIEDSSDASVYIENPPMKHSSLSYRDLARLDDNGWLNDEVISAYCELIDINTERDILILDPWFMASLSSKKGWEGMKTWSHWKACNSYVEGHLVC